MSAEPILEPEDELLDAGPGEHDLENDSLSVDAYRFLESLQETVSEPDTVSVRLTGERPFQ